MLRYKSSGEVHKDFHGLTCATIHYILDNYGKDALDEILKSTAQKVYNPKSPENTITILDVRQGRCLPRRRAA